MLWRVPDTHLCGTSLILHAGRCTFIFLLFGGKNREQVFEFILDSTKAWSECCGYLTILIDRYMPWWRCNWYGARSGWQGRISMSTIVFVDLLLNCSRLQFHVYAARISIITLLTHINSSFISIQMLHASCISSFWDCCGKYSQPRQHSQCKHFA